MDLKQSMAAWRHQRARIAASGIEPNQTRTAVRTILALGAIAREMNKKRYRNT